MSDDGIVSCVTALGCLRSPPISSIIADVKNAKSNQGQHRCLPKATTPASTGPTTSTALDDLIHLPGPLTEDAVLKCLQARFCAKQYHVSILIFLIELVLIVQMKRKKRNKIKSSYRNNDFGSYLFFCPFLYFFRTNYFQK